MSYYGRDHTYLHQDVGTWTLALVLSMLVVLEKEIKSILGSYGDAYSLLSEIGP